MIVDSLANRKQGSHFYLYCVAENKYLWQIFLTELYATNKHLILLAKVIAHFAQDEITQDSLS